MHFWNKKTRNIDPTLFPCEYQPISAAFKRFTYIEPRSSCLLWGLLLRDQNKFCAFRANGATPKGWMLCVDPSSRASKRHTAPSTLKPTSHIPHKQGRTPKRDTDLLQVVPNDPEARLPGCGRPAASVEDRKHQACFRGPNTYVMSYDPYCTNTNRIKQGDVQWSKCAWSSL